MWYADANVGKNPIGDFMKTMSKRANLSQVYTNHCIRKTCVTALSRSVSNPLLIPSVSGHKNLKSLEPYINKPTIEERAQLGDALNKYVNKPEIPATVFKPPTPSEAENEVADEPSVDMAPSSVDVEMPQKENQSFSTESGPSANYQAGGGDSNANGKQGLVIGGGTFQNCTIQFRM